MNKYVLAATRWVVGVAHALHLSALRAAVVAGERRIERTLAKTDLARAAHYAASETALIARDAVRAAQAVEREVTREVRAIKTAIVAEADTLSRRHGIS